MIIIQSLLQRAAQLEVDKDDLIVKLQSPDVLLIRLAPQEFPFETHKVQERILCLDGEFGLDYNDGQGNAHSVRIPQGHLASIAPGITHRFSSDSRASILTLYGDASETIAPPV
jgi:hypothetical protein